MELSFTGGRFVSNRGELNYKEVLEHFPNASIIRIITYNISRNQRQDKLFEALRDTDAEIQLITNVPSRMEEYFDNEAGRSMRKTARRNIQIYIAKLNPENFSGNFLPYFNLFVRGDSLILFQMKVQIILKREFLLRIEIL